MHRGIRQMLGGIVWSCVALWGCKTSSTAEPDSELAAWASPADKEAARQYFKQILNDCVPALTAAVPGGHPVVLAGDAGKQAVVDQFATAIVEADTPQTESMAFVLKSYYAARAAAQAPCAGEAAEYAVTEFARQTNLVNIVAGDAVPLRFVGISSN